MQRVILATALVLALGWPARSWSPQEMRSAAKGNSTPLPITGTSIDANHNGLDVNIVVGSGSGGPQYAEDSAHVSGDSVTSASAALSTGGSARSWNIEPDSLDRWRVQHVV